MPLHFSVPFPHSTTQSDSSSRPVAPVRSKSKRKKPSGVPADIAVAGPVGSPSRTSVLHPSTESSSNMLGHGADESFAREGGGDAHFPGSKPSNNKEAEFPLLPWRRDSFVLELSRSDAEGM